MQTTEFKVGLPKSRGILTVCAAERQSGGNRAAAFGKSRCRPCRPDGHELRKHTRQQVNQQNGGAAWLSRIDRTRWMETRARAGSSAHRSPISNAPATPAPATATATAPAH